MPQAHVAAQMSLSRATVAKWWSICNASKSGAGTRTAHPLRWDGDDLLNPSSNTFSGQLGSGADLLCSQSGVIISYAAIAV